ncbi:MAG TPA: integrase arm-type DNA-binding domain-containing protein [Noviherbaspirillum sp.]|nr:integrase arm-type DNA-binding domain-containing protein [Noviherbaspirillum sp.]
MPTNKLTDRQCRAAESSTKAVKLFDGGGLHLFVSPTGAKSWRLAYRIDGRPQTMSFGSYPEVSLAAARARRDEVKATLRDGGDPMAPRRVKRAGMTLEEASGEYWKGRRDVSDSYRANAERAIAMHLLPTLGKRNIASIERQDLLPALQAMDAAGLAVYVRKVRMWIGQVFDWAVENGHAKINPAALIDPRKAFAKATVEHFAALDVDEVPELMQRLSMEQDLQSVLACRLLALTWVRTVELRMMKFEEIDGDIWRIPAGKMKRKRDHLVPLSRQALALLKELKMRSRGSAYVFPAEHRDDRPMSENSILYLLWRMGYRGRMTGHGWRTIASTWANERGFNRDAIERQLAHAPDDKVRAAYNRAEYLPERRVMLQEWADWLDSCQVDAGRAQGREAPALRAVG